MDTTLREIQTFHPMHLAGAHGIGQPPMKCSKCAIAYLLARLEKAEAAVRKFGKHLGPDNPHQSGFGCPRACVNQNTCGASHHCVCGFATWQEEQEDA